MAVMKFELEQVLNYRREMEKVRKQEFAVAKQELEAAHDILDQYHNQVTKLTDEFNHKQSELHTIDELTRYVQYFAKKRLDIERQKETIEQLDGVMNDRREYLLDAAKDKKVLESLKERKTKEFQNELAHKERAFLDEISVQKNSGSAQ